MSYGVWEQWVQAHICWFSLEGQALKRVTLHKCPIQPHFVLRFKNLRDSQQEKRIMPFVSFVKSGKDQVMPYRSLILIEE